MHHQFRILQSARCSRRIVLLGSAGPFAQLGGMPPGGVAGGEIKNICAGDEARHARVAVLFDVIAALNLMMFLVITKSCDIPTIKQHLNAAMNAAIFLEPECRKRPMGA